MIAFSVLDLSPIVQGATAADAFRNTLELAQHVERLGFTRFWLAEHHNIAGVASSATAVLIGAHQSIGRKQKLTALIEGAKLVDRVEVVEVSFPAYQQAGRHLHPLARAHVARISRAGARRGRRAVPRGDELARIREPCVRSSSS